MKAKLYKPLKEFAWKAATEEERNKYTIKSYMREEEEFTG